MQKNDRRELSSQAPERCESIVESILNSSKTLPRLAAIVDQIRRTGVPYRALPSMTAILDAHQAIAAMKDDRFREFIYQSHDLLTHAHEKYESVDDIKRELNSESARFVTLLENLILRVEVLESFIVLITASDQLMDQKWLELAKSPKQFNTEVSLQLRTIKTSMKKFYGVLSHRLQTNRTRDKELWLVKRRRPILSFGQLGRQFGMSSGAALLAYRRQVRREMVYLKSLGQAAAAFYEEYQAFYQRYQRAIYLGLLEHPDSEGSAPSPTEVGQTSVPKS